MVCNICGGAAGAERGQASHLAVGSRSSHARGASGCGAQSTPVAPAHHSTQAAAGAGRPPGARAETQRSYVTADQSAAEVSRRRPISAQIESPATSAHSFIAAENIGPLGRPSRQSAVARADESPARSSPAMRRRRRKEKSSEHILFFGLEQQTLVF